MQHCRLPIEICEQVIDECANNAYTNSDWHDWWQEYRREPTLLACALTCKAWLPRSLIHLYHSIFLYGDDQTRNMVQWLSERYDDYGRLDIAPPFYLVPRLLDPLKQIILGIQTVEISPFRRRSVEASTLLGASTNDSFLRSYTCFRSTHTLNLSNIRFDTFSYFARLMLCFRALRHLDLLSVRVNKLDRHPPRIAKLKQLSLHTLIVYHSNELSLIHLADWLRQAGALSQLELLSFHSDSEGHGKAVAVMIVNAGESLKHLKFGGPAHGGFDCHPSSVLETIKLWELSADIVISILSTVSSRRGCSRCAPRF